jgi:hypothetical protein
MTAPPYADVLEVENADQGFADDSKTGLPSEATDGPAPLRRQRKGAKPPAPELCEKTNTIWI